MNILSHSPKKWENWRGFNRKAVFEQVKKIWEKLGRCNRSDRSLRPSNLLGFVLRRGGYISPRSWQPGWPGRNTGIWAEVTGCLTTTGELPSFQAPWRVMMCLKRGWPCSAKKHAQCLKIGPGKKMEDKPVLSSDFGSSSIRKCSHLSWQVDKHHWPSVYTLYSWHILIILYH